MVLTDVIDMHSLHLFIFLWRPCKDLHRLFVLLLLLDHHHHLLLWPALLIAILLQKLPSSIRWLNSTNQDRCETPPAYSNPIQSESQPPRESPNVLSDCLSGGNRERQLMSVGRLVSSTRKYIYSITTTMFVDDTSLLDRMLWKET